MNKFFTSTSAKTFLTATVLMLLMFLNQQTQAQNCTWNYHPNATNQAVPCNNTVWSTPANMGNGAYQHLNLVSGWPYYASTNIAKHLTVYDDQPGWTAQTNGAGTSGVAWTSRSSNVNGNFISVQNNNTCPQWQAGATSAVLSVRTNFTVPNAMSGAETVCAGATQSAIYATGFNGNVSAFTFDWYYVDGTANPSAGGWIYAGTIVGNNGAIVTPTSVTRSWNCYFYPTGNSGCFAGWSTAYITKTVNATSNAGTVTQNPASNGTVCAGSPVTYTTSGQTGTFNYYEYQWNGTAGAWSGSWLTSNPATWTSGLNGASVLYVRSVVTNGVCPAAVSAPVNITVQSTANNPGAMTPSASAICVGGSAAINNVTAATTGTPASSVPTYTYYWKRTSAPATAYAVYETSTNLTSTLPVAVTGTAGTYLLARNSSFTCAAQLNNATTVDIPFTVDAASVLGTPSVAANNFCEVSGNFTTATTVSGNVGTVTWEWGSNNGSWNAWLVANASGVCCFPKKTSNSDANADRMRYSVKNGTCPATAVSSTILNTNKFNEAPTALASSASSYCANAVPATITLTATFPAVINKNGTVVFYSGSCGGTAVGSVTAGDNTNTAAITITAPSTTTNYYVRYEPGTGTTCSNSTCFGPTAVTVNAIPTSTGVSFTANPICTGNSTTVNSNALAGSGSISTYAWSVGVTPSNATSGTVSAASTYTVTVTNSNGCVTSFTSAALALDAVVSITNAPSNNAICESGSFTYTASLSGGTWSSSNTGVFTINSTTGAVTPVAIGGTTQSTTANVIYTRGTCSASVALRIDNQNAISTATTPRCESSLSAVAAIIGDVNGVAWTVFSSTGLTSPAVSANGTNNKNADITYGTVAAPTQNGSLTIQAVNGQCAAVQATIAVNNQNAITTATTPRCESASSEVGAIIGDVNGVAWTVFSSTGLTSQAVSANGTNNKNADITYGTVTAPTQNGSLTIQAVNGACIAQQATIVVNNTPYAYAGTNQAACVTSSFVMAGNDPTTGTGAVNGSSGVWTCVSSPCTGVGPAGSFNGTTTNVAVGTSSTLRWTVTNGACSVTDDVVLTNDQQNSIGGNTTLCDFNDNSGTNTYSYTSTPASSIVWSVSATPSGNAGAITSGGVYSPVDLTGNIASQTVVISAQNGTCTANYNITLYNQPTISSPTGIALCQSQSTSLTADITTGVTWVVSQGAASCPGGTSAGCLSGLNFTAPDPGAGSATYKIKASTQGACFADVTFQIDKALTISGFTLPTTPVCDNTVLSGISSTPAALWSITSGGGSLTTTGSPTVNNTYTPAAVSTPTQNATGNIRIVSTNGACTYNYAIRIDNDNSISTANNTVVCDAATPTISGDVSNVTWSFTSALTGTAVTGPSQNTTLTPGNVAAPTAQSSITVTATNGACTAKSITVLVDKQNSIAEAAGTYGICDASGATTLFTGDVTGTVWSSGTPGNATIATPAVNGVVTPAVIAGATPNATTVITATNGVCTPVTRTVRVDNNPAITTPASPACDNTTPDFNLSDLAESNVTWSADFGTITNSGTRGLLSYTVVLPATSQLITVTATNGECAPTATITMINAPSTPDAGPDQVYYPNVACGVLSTTLAGSVAPVPNSGSWTQVSGPGTSTFNANNHQNNAGVTATTYGTYVYQWQIIVGSCASPVDQVTVIYDPVFNRTVTEEPCMSMSEATYNTPGNINYSYFVLAASGGLTPYTFPTDDLPRRKQVGTVTTGTSYAYELDATEQDIFVVIDSVGCSAGSSVVNPTFTSVPTELAVSSGVGAVSESCNNSYNRWVTYVYDSLNLGTVNQAILAINARNNDLGRVTVNMYREGDEPIVPNSSWAGFTCPGTWMRPMERHFMVTTSNAPSDWGNTGNKVGVRLFFTHQELVDLIAETYGVAGSSNFGDGCLANDDVTNLNDLYVTKYTAPPGSMNTENESYADNIANQNNPSAIYRMFGENTTPALGNGPLRKDYENTIGQSKNFDQIYGRSTPSILAVPQPNHFVEMDVTEFSEFWLHGTTHITPLPVEMIYLEATPVNNAFIQVKWATAIEVNNDGFQVERSIDGQTWATIGWVNGNDNTTTQTNYHFDDVSVVANTVYYYRLKQVDNDGAFEYTDIVSARINGEVSFSVKDFIPNPTMDKTSLVVTASNDQDITVTFYNVVGQKVLESSHQLNKGGNRLEFDLGKLASGTYTAIVSSANDVYTKKVVLARQ